MLAFVGWLWGLAGFILYTIDSEFHPPVSWMFVTASVGLILTASGVVTSDPTLILTLRSSGAIILGALAIYSMWELIQSPWAEYRDANSRPKDRDNN